MGSSISEPTGWVDVCGEYARGERSEHDFRRLKPVRDIVETVGPVDAAYYHGLVEELGTRWLEDPRIAALDDWGNPLRCPAWWLGGQRAWSPTTLRYLATALWLGSAAGLSAGTQVVEIGVGFGGLAAMNAWVNRAETLLVDLPDVAKAAERMLRSHHIDGCQMAGDGDTPPSGHWVISNYAFTELSKPWQDRYLEQYLRQSAHGMILSNAGVFGARIEGRDDASLVSWLRDAGLPAVLDDAATLLSPGDALCGVRMIRW
jgi:hypothetical protein